MLAPLAEEPCRTESSDEGSSASALLRRRRRRLPWSWVVTLTVTLVLLVGAATSPLIVTFLVNALEARATAFSLRPTADGALVTGRIACSSPVKAHADPGMLDVYYGAEKVGTLHHGEMTLGGENPLSGNLSLVEKSGGALVTAALALVDRDITLTLSGNMDLSIFGMGFRIGLHKDLTIPSLGGLPSSVDGMFIAPKKSAAQNSLDEVAVSLNATMRSPSFVEMPLGLADLDVFFGEERLGRISTHSEVVVSERPASLVGSGTLFRARTSAHAGALSALFSAYLSGRPTTLEARGAGQAANAVKYPWVDSLLKQVRLRVALPGYRASPVVGLEVPSAGFGVTDDASPVTLNASMALTSYLPMMSFPFSVSRVTAKGTLGTGEAPKAFAVSTSSPASYTPLNASAGLVKVEMATHGTVQDMNAAQTFLARAVQDKSVTMGLDFEASMQMSCALGDLNITIPLRRNVTIQGFNGVPGTRVHFIDVNEANPDHVNLVLHSTVPNPTGISLAVPDLPLELFYEGQKIGAAHSANTRLGARHANELSNQIKISSVMTPLFDSVVSKYASNRSTSYVMRGAPGPSTPQLLVPALQALSTTAVATGLEEGGIPGVLGAARLGVGVVWPFFTAQVQLVNPWNTRISFTSFSLSVRIATGEAMGLVLGHINITNATKYAVEAAPRSSAWSRWIPTQLDIGPCKHATSIGKCTHMLKELVVDGKVRVDIVEGNIAATVGDGFQARITDFEQRDVPLTIAFWGPGERKAPLLQRASSPTRTVAI